MLACRDLKGDGQLEVVLFYHLSCFPNNHQLWLAALSLRDGKTLWRQPLTERIDDGFFPIVLSSQPTQPAIADLYGDGVLDLVIAVPVPAEIAGGMGRKVAEGADGNQPVAAQAEKTGGMWGNELRGERSRRQAALASAVAPAARY